MVTHRGGTDEGEQQGSGELQVLCDCGAIGAERAAFRARHKLLGVGDVLLCRGAPGFSRQGQFSLLASTEVVVEALAEDGGAGTAAVVVFAPSAEKAVRLAAAGVVVQN